jgi:hypothetical protein
MAAGETTMKFANVPHVVKDPSRNNTCVIYAYRNIDEFEVWRLLWAFLTAKERLGHNNEYELFTFSAISKRSSTVRRRPGA